MTPKQYETDQIDSLLRHRTAALTVPPVLQMDQPALGKGPKYREEVDAIAESRHRSAQAKAVEELIAALNEDAARLENGENPAAVNQNGSVAMLARDTVSRFRRHAEKLRKGRYNRESFAPPIHTDADLTGDKLGVMDIALTAGVATASEILTSELGLAGSIITSTATAVSVRLLAEHLKKAGLTDTIPWR